MAIDILFYNETDVDVEVYESVIKDIIQEAVSYEGLQRRLTCNYIFVNNKRIRSLNAAYRKKDCATDVLTFMAEDEGIYRERKNLGDVFISVDKMIEQSYAYGHGEVREMAFLALHGFLHLLGYDHLDEAGEKVMNEKQEVILDAKDIRR